MTNAIVEAAGRYIGTKEVAGAGDNPKIREMFNKAVGKPSPDSVPWCAAFVGAVLKDVGLKGTNKLNARSYLNWGTSVDKPRPGDVVIFWRGKKDGWQGHVAFFLEDRGNFVLVRGGNQQDAVSDQEYSSTRVLGYRRMEVPEVKQAVKKNPSVAIPAAAGVGAAIAIFFNDIKEFFLGLF